MTTIVDKDYNLEKAFRKICSEAKDPEGFYVSLYQRVQRYGGPEEGGWWTTDVHMLYYQHFCTEDRANDAKNRVEELAKKLDREALMAHGRRCQNELDFADARLIDDSNAVFGEVDGPTTYSVVIEEQPGQNESRGPTHYE